jgi:hypothetical protein
MEKRIPRETSSLKNHWGGGLSALVPYSRFANTSGLNPLGLNVSLLTPALSATPGLASLLCSTASRVFIPIFCPKNQLLCSQIARSTNRNPQI